MANALTLHYDSASTDDMALVERARRDTGGFEPLYRRHRDRLYGYLLARSGNEEDAADLTQHVFLQAYLGLEKYREDKGSFAAWLFGIARHAATDFHRRRRVAVQWEYLPADVLTSDRDDLEADAMRREQTAHVRDLLEALPKEKREILVLRFVGDLTIPEIAAVIGKSPEATRKQLTRTLNLLEGLYHDAP
jgi:RNA polymerase sigma-70 factor (ECF subfamily)